MRELTNDTENKLLKVSSIKVRHFNLAKKNDNIYLSNMCLCKRASVIQSLYLTPILQSMTFGKSKLANRSFILRKSSPSLSTTPQQLGTKESKASSFSLSKHSFSFSENFFSMVPSSPALKLPGQKHTHTKDDCHWSTYCIINTESVSQSTRSQSEYCAFLICE